VKVGVDVGATVGVGGAGVGWSVGGTLQPESTSRPATTVRKKGFFIIVASLFVTAENNDHFSYPLYGEKKRFSSLISPMKPVLATRVESWLN